MIIRLATMLAVVTTDYPLEPGEATTSLQAAVDASFNWIPDGRRVLDERGAVVLSRPARACARDDDALAAALRAVRRSSPTARARRCSPRSPSGAPRASRRQAIAPPHRDLAAASSHFRPEHGAACLQPRLRALRRRLRAPRSGPRETLLSTALRYHTACGSERRSGRRGDIELKLALGHGTASYLTSDLSYDYVRIEREGTGHEIAKVGGEDGGGPFGAGGGVLARGGRRRGHCGTGPQITAEEMVRLASPVEFVRGHGVTKQRRRGSACHCRRGRPRAVRGPRPARRCALR